MIGHQPRRALDAGDVRAAERDGFDCGVARLPADPPPFYDDPSPSFSYATLREAFRAGHARGVRAIGGAP